MKREHEAQMFAIAALRSGLTAGKVDFLEQFTTEIVQGEPIEVLSPKGSKFKNCCCIVKTGSLYTATTSVLREYGPDLVSTIGGNALFLFTGGQHVMEATGAAAALRKQEEG